ncbi:MAG: TlpA family protein disulfide reductase [Planctomycetes bacterium]|nr:TlpA family protein disulfide reductase [Planctomycetota bacterium]
MKRSRVWLTVFCVFFGLCMTGSRGAPLDDYYKLEEQIVAAHEAYMFALEQLEADGKSKKKAPADSRSGILEKMDALIERTHGTEEGAPIAIGAFYWSWNFDLDLENLFGRFEEIVKHYPDDTGLDDLVPQAVEAALSLKQPDSWAGALDTLARTTTRKKTQIDGLTALGQLQLRAHKPAKAKSAFTRLVALDLEDEIRTLATGYLYEIDHLQIGMTAPDFTTKTLEGKTVSLKSFRGKAVLLNFWASW